MSSSDIRFKDSHIFRMTDDTGMFQHAQFSIPNLDKGYTTDDNVRALIMAVMLYEKNPKSKYLKLVYRYLAFAIYAQNEQGNFRNFMTYNRQFTETVGSEDCFGRCLWALGYTLASPAMPDGIKNACLTALKKALPQVRSLSWLRGKAYALIGMSYYDGAETTSYISEIADSLANHFTRCSKGPEWQWFEDNITYDNTVLPWAMFIACEKTGQTRFGDIARESLAFLDHTLFRDGFFCPVGCDGWWRQGAEPALYDQQPVEASMSTLAHLAAYQLTGDTTMLEFAKRSFAWYLGDNISNLLMIDAESGGCYDGITPDGVNRNQGAESIVGYCIAHLALEKSTRNTAMK